MKAKTSKRKIVETAVGAALGAAIAGPPGALAGGLVANRAAAGLEHFGEGPKKARKRSTPRVKNPVIQAKLKKILAPLDFSPPSLNAVRFAAKWASRFGAELCLVHVVESVNITAPFGAEPVALRVPPADFPERIKAGMEKVAKRECQAVSKVSVHLREGIAYDQIVAAARTLKADLIIIATHGRSGLMRALMGSTAERVVRHAPCPVLVVPPGGKK